MRQTTPGTFPAQAEITDTSEHGLYSAVNEHDACGIGFVANINGQQSHDILQRGLQVLERMAHRGAEGADNETGDGAGILMQIPSLFQNWIPNLPKTGQYGTGLVFLDKEPPPLK